MDVSINDMDVNINDMDVSINDMRLFHVCEEISHGSEQESMCLKITIEKRIYYSRLDFVLQTAIETEVVLISNKSKQNQETSPKSSRTKFYTYLPHAIKYCFSSEWY